MPSLTSKIREREEKDKKEKYTFDNVLFISDVKFSQVAFHLSEFQGIRECDECFTNRSCEDLIKKEVKHIWVNIGNSMQKEWLEVNLLKNKSYTSVLVYQGTKRNKFLKDLDGKVDIKIKLKDLNKLKSLSFDDLLNQAEHLLTIHSPAKKIDKLLSCLGCGSKNLVKEKNSNE